MPTFPNFFNKTQITPFYIKVGCWIKYSSIETQTYQCSVCVKSFFIYLHPFGSLSPLLGHWVAGTSLGGLHPLPWSDKWWRHTWSNFMRKKKLNWSIKVRLHDHTFSKYVCQFPSFIHNLWSLAVVLMVCLHRHWDISPQMDNLGDFQTW